MTNNYINYILTIYWYLMKIFVYFNNILKYIIIKYNSYFNNDQNTYNILYIKDSLIVSKSKTIDSIDPIDKLYINYDYIIYKILSNEKILMALYTCIDDISIELTPCNFEFLLVMVKVNGESYDISSILKNNNNYYYIVNNYLFNKSFMNWLFINHLKKINTFLKYDIVFLDNMANENTINETQYIKLNKTNYEIINN